ncbi:MAG: hypothetical protein M3042_01080 [Actinomycetota bacterium]|nr:hypothetical protein [Actinomycetota bacterium]
MRATTRIRDSHPLPWLLWALSMVLLAAGLWLAGIQAAGSSSPGFPGWGAVSLNVLAFAGVGAVIASRRPENAIGWLFVAVGAASALQLVTAEYATYNHYVLRDRLWGTAATAWVSQVSVAALFGVLPFVLMLFPDGHLLSHRWRLAAWLAGAAAICSVVAVAIKPGVLGNTVGIPNPLAVSAHGAALRLLDVLSGLPQLVCLLLGVGSLVIRWRRGGAEQREQLKWVSFAAAAGFGGILVGTLLIPVAGELPSQVAWTVGPAALPVAAGVSVLRYRLYDIDRIISRTVSYALITGLLVAVYVGLVTAVTRVTPSGNSLGVAASTLAVAGLFQPVRRRVQAIVDRRFNRSRYDTARTVEAFNVRLRNEVDLDALQGDILSVVRRTMEPVNASLWLRGSG